MGEEFFFYYEYYEEVRLRRRRPREHISHITEEVEDFVSKTEGVARPRILEEHRPGEIIYYVELLGVSKKDNIKIELEEDTLRIRARLDKALMYPGLTGSTIFKEYAAEISLPSSLRPEDISVYFDKDRHILIIRVRKRRTSIPIEIE